MDGVSGDRASHQTGDPRQAYEKHPLFPHLQNNCGARPRVELCMTDLRRDSIEARRAAAVALAESQQMRVIKVKHAAAIVEWKAKIAFSPAYRDTAFSSFESPLTNRWIEADVVLKRCKVHEHAVQFKCRNLVADDLLRVGSGAAHSLPNLPQNYLYIGRKTRDVPVDSLRDSTLGRHKSAVSPHISTLEDNGIPA